MSSTLHNHSDNDHNDSNTSKKRYDDSRIHFKRDSWATDGISKGEVSWKLFWLTGRPSLPSLPPCAGEPYYSGQYQPGQFTHTCSTWCPVDYSQIKKCAYHTICALCLSTLCALPTSSNRQRIIAHYHLKPFLPRLHFWRCTNAAMITKTKMAKITAVPITESISYFPTIIAEPSILPYKYQRG